MNDPARIDRNTLVARLVTLKSEYTSGQRLLADLDTRAATLREQLLRIEGAAHVLGELLQASSETACGMTPAAEAEAAATD